jgi:membrane protease YdiL (CAAX protease family)
MSIAPQPALEADPPPPAAGERDGFPRWPLWLPLAALAGGVGFGFVAIGVLVGVLDATGIEPDASAPGVTDAGTVIIDLAVVTASVMLAAITARPRGWHFGLRRAPLGLTAGIAAIGVFAFFAFELVYGAIVEPKSSQTVVQDLGADKNSGLLVAGALVVIVVAPICEELFFRGFLFRVLRLRLPLWLAAVADGVVFGFVHYQDGLLLILPILAFLGVVLCYVYERTGTLFATIAIHALNNTISYGATTDDGWAAALSVGAVMLVLCAIGVVRASGGGPAAAANPPVASSAS